MSDINSGENNKNKEKMSRNFKFFLTSFFLSLPLWWGINIFQQQLQSAFYAQVSQPLQEITFLKIPQKTESPKIDLQARSAISVKINKEEGWEILLKKDIDSPLPIASLTKLMTALVVLQNTSNDDFNFSKIVKISKTAANQENVLPVFGNLDEGEKIKIEELLKIMLVYSSNDAAQALSEIIGADIFVEKMNQKAKDLELLNTHFINPTGLDPENLKYQTETKDYFNYSTTRDLIKLAQYILKEYPLIFEISTSNGSYDLKNGISDLILPKELKFLGGKTGYTEEAGGCILLVLSDQKENKIINVILGTPALTDRISEMQKIIGWLNLTQ